MDPKATPITTENGNAKNNSRKTVAGAASAGQYRGRVAAATSGASSSSREPFEKSSVETIPVDRWSGTRPLWTIDSGVMLFTAIWYPVVFVKFARDCFSEKTQSASRWARTGFLPDFSRTVVSLSTFAGCPSDPGQ